MAKSFYKLLTQLHCFTQKKWVQAPFYPWLLKISALLALNSRSGSRFSLLALAPGSGSLCLYFPLWRNFLHSCLNIPFCLCHSVAFKPNGTIYLFPLLGSLALSLYSIESPSEHQQSWHSVFRKGDHLFCNGRDHRAIEIPKNSILVYTEKCTKNMGKFAKLSFIGLQISLNPPQIPIGSA